MPAPSPHPGSLKKTKTKTRCPASEPLADSLSLPIIHTHPSQTKSGANLLLLSTDGLFFTGPSGGTTQLPTLSERHWRAPHTQTCQGLSLVWRWQPLIFGPPPAAAGSEPGGHRTEKQSWKGPVLVLRGWSHVSVSPQLLPNGKTCISPRSFQCLLLSLPHLFLSQLPGPGEPLSLQGRCGRLPLSLHRGCFESDLFYMSASCTKLVSSWGL